MPASSEGLLVHHDILWDIMCWDGPNMTVQLSFFLRAVVPLWEPILVASFNTNDFPRASPPQAILCENVKMTCLSHKLLWGPICKSEHGSVQSRSKQTTKWWILCFPWTGMNIFSSPWISGLLEFKPLGCKIDTNIIPLSKSSFP